MALTTLILGAGLGKEYGFPDGPELRHLILDELPSHDQKLREIFRWSPAETVDAIAARYSEYANQIRRIVTKILWERESESPFLQSSRNTYSLMLEQIATAQTKGDQVRIVTFNYDRSLQHLLWKVNLVSPQAKRIDPAIINAIYGRLAPLHFESGENQGRRMYVRTENLVLFEITWEFPVP